MSASSHSFPKLRQDPDVLGELLHSLSQPLTSLRCSLELSLDDVTEQQQESVSDALQQTEKVIGMIQLMREYVDAEQSGAECCPVALAPALRSVIEELSSIAAVRGVRLRLAGTCTATVRVPESRLRLALQYLITTTMEAQPVGGKVMFLLSEGPGGAVLRAEGERGFHEVRRGGRMRPPRIRATTRQATSVPTTAGAARTASTASTLCRIRLAIASRMLETAGASMVFGNGDVGSAGFVLRIPRRVGTPA
jgi:signal transduction histidine kinase